MKLRNILQFTNIKQINLKTVLACLAVTILSLIIFLTSTNFYLLFKKVAATQESIVFSELEKKALILSSVIDLNTYEEILKSKIKIENEKYLKVLAPLRKAHFSIEGMRYVYTVYENNGKIYFGLDTALNIDADHDGIIDHSTFGSEYNDAPKEIIQAISSKHMVLTEKPYTDKYGTFISAFVPLINHKGEIISVLGVDMLYSQYLILQENYKNLILKIYVICITLIVAFTVILYVFYNKLGRSKIQEISLKNEIKDQQNFFIQDSKMAEIGKMMAGITHEINNPLTIIKGVSDQGIKKLNRQDVSNETHMKNYESIKHSTDRIIEVIKNMKSIISRPIGTEDFYFFSVNEALSNVMKAVKYKSITDDIKFHIDVDDALLIHGNRSQLEQVFFNLISNSIDSIAGQSSAWIKIETTADENFIFLHFVDSGNGIPDKMYKKIEKGYYTSKSGGSGMGLMICKKIIEIHQGNLSLVKGRNTHFVLKLPRNCEIHNEIEAA